MPNDAFGGAKPAEGDAGGHDSDGESSAEAKQEATTDEPVGAAADADMDVAEDEDQWL